MRGKTERAAGNAEYDAARAKGYAKATGGRMAGKKDQIVGAVTGDRSQQLKGRLSEFSYSSCVGSLTLCSAHTRKSPKR